MHRLPRLIYLADHHRPKITKRITNLIPQGDLLYDVAKVGARGAQAEHDIEWEQLKHLLEEGETEGEGSKEEFKIMAADLATSELELRRPDMKMTSWLRQIGYVTKFLDGEADELVGMEEMSWNEATTGEEMPKFMSGFSPVDVVTGGLYQGIMTIMARPGDGKTSMMLSMAESIRRSNAADSIWFFELEIPLALMRYRTEPLRDRVQFLSQDRLVSGLVGIDDLLEQIEDNPDPNRVVFYDSPDVLAGGSEAERRFKIEEIYRELIKVKQKSKLVVVASQPRRKDRQLSLDSVAEAWSKAWYSDIVLSVNRAGQAPGGFTRVRMKTHKNRFGISDQEITFRYHYGNLSWQAPGGTDATGWEDGVEDGEW